MAIERVKTGVPGLDELIGGGIPKKSVVLVAGGPGAGKTTLCLQYIYHGALNGEPGVFVSFEQDPERLKASAKELGMDFDKLEKEGKAVILRVRKVVDITNVLQTIKRNIERIHAKRLVVDSLSAVELFASTFKSMIRELPPGVAERPIGIYPPTESLVRRVLYRVVDYLNDFDVTTLMTSEAHGDKYSRYGVAEFVADGLMKMEFDILGKSMQRNIVILKLRDTPISGGRYGIELGKNGVRLTE